MLRLPFLAIWLLATSLLLAQSGLGLSEAYPQYWTYDGEPRLLLGGSVEDNLFQIPDLEAQLDLLAASGGNYVRNTLSSRDSGNLWAFHWDETEQLYDLSKWNDAYWTRFERFLQLTAERDIVVQIELWATFDFYRDNWEVNPFNPQNNSTYSVERSKLPTEVKTHPIFTDNPFFRSVPLARHNIPVLGAQQAFIDKLLAYALAYDHVLYCIDNETSVTAAWGKFWADYLHTKAREAGKQVFVTEMWDPWDLAHLTHRETFDHPETYDFVEISQNNHMRGQAHWDNGLAQIERLRAAGNLRPVNNIKIYGSDGGRHGGGTDDGIEKFIRGVLFGAASVRFHRPTSGLGLNEAAQAVIRSMRDLTDRMDFFAAAPHQDLLGEREENEAYCRAQPGREYAVYFTDGGEVPLDLTAAAGPGEVKWLEVMRSDWQEGKAVPGGKVTRFAAPGEGHWLLWVRF
jgi:hypothetical protein